MTSYFVEQNVKPQHKLSMQADIIFRTVQPLNTEWKHTNIQQHTTDALLNTAKDPNKLSIQTKNPSKAVQLCIYIMLNTETQQHNILFLLERSFNPETYGNRPP